MNWDEIEGNWKQFKGKVRSQWGKLTDDDVTRQRQTQRTARPSSERYGHAKEEAEREIDWWIKQLK